MSSPNCISYSPLLELYATSLNIYFTSSSVVWSVLTGTILTNLFVFTLILYVLLSDFTTDNVSSLSIFSLVRVPLTLNDSIIFKVPSDPILLSAH